MIDKETKNKILMVYGLFGMASALLCVIPSVLISSIGGLLLILALLTSWAFRAKAAKDSALYQHMLYVGRTIWMGMFIASITVLPAIATIMLYADNSIYDRFMSDVMNGIVYSDVMIEQALSEYIKTNMTILFMAAFIYCFPPTAYVAHRIYRGVRYVTNDIDLPADKAWS